MISSSTAAVLISACITSVSILPTPELNTNPQFDRLVNPLLHNRAPHQNKPSQLPSSDTVDANPPTLHWTRNAIAVAAIHVANNAILHQNPRQIAPWIVLFLRLPNAETRLREQDCRSTLLRNADVQVFRFVSTRSPNELKVPLPLEMLMGPYKLEFCFYFYFGCANNMLGHISIFFMKMFVSFVCHIDKDIF